LLVEEIKSFSSVEFPTLWILVIATAWYHLIAASVTVVPESGD
jgi:hypothetical protein